jgi:hypothetical protein
MPTVLKNDIHTNVAQIVYKGIRNRTTRAYFFLGKALPWNSTETVETPSASRDYEFDTRSDIIGMKNVTSTDISFAIERQDWSSGTVYDMYDDRYSSEYPSPSGATDIADAKMFVVTDEFNIYKCISNNYGAPSTVKPTGTSIGYLEFADGYIWKYMDTVDELQRSKFLTPQYLPITNTVNERYFSAGLSPIVINPGSGYVQSNVSCYIAGDGTGAALNPIIDENGQIESVEVVNPGSNYSTAVVEVLTPDPDQPQGTGGEISVSLDYGDLNAPQAEVQLSAVSGEISFVYVTDSGSGYSDATVTIEGNGVEATASPIIENGMITGIILNNRGEGYTTATATITSNTGSGASAYVIISPSGGHGRDLVNESFANILSFQISTLDEVNQGFLLDNDYRQSGLIFDPDKYPVEGELRQKVVSEYASACHVFEIEGENAEDFVQDQVIYEQVTGSKMYIVQSEDWVDTGVTIGARLLVQSSENFSPEVGDTFADEEGSTLFTLADETSNIVKPEVDKFSGSMVFINNRSPYRKTAEQIVNVRTYIKF